MKIKSFQKKEQQGGLERRVNSWKKYYTGKIDVRKFLENNKEKGMKNMKDKLGKDKITTNCPWNDSSSIIQHNFLRCKRKNDLIIQHFKREEEITYYKQKSEEKTSNKIGPWRTKK